MYDTESSFYATEAKQPEVQVQRVPLLSIVVTREGVTADKCVKFQLVDHAIDNKHQRHGVGQVVGLDTTVCKQVTESDSVIVYFRPSQELSEVLVTRIAQAIGNALGFNPGNISVEVKTL